MLPLGDIFSASRGGQPSVLRSLVVLEVVCIAHAVPQGFVILWIFWTGGGNQGQQPLSPGSITLLRSRYYLTAVLGLIL